MSEVMRYPFVVFGFVPGGVMAFGPDWGVLSEKATEQRGARW